MPYDNPIIPGFYPDPSVCRVSDDYYLVTSTFEYFPGVPIFHSRDMVNWRQIGHCLTRPGQLELPALTNIDKRFAHTPGFTGGIYAPTLRYYDGHFYMVTTNVSQGGHFFVHTDDPAGEWSAPVWVDYPNSIDPSLFFDDDGTAYFTCTGQYHQGGIHQFEIDMNNGKLRSMPRSIWMGSGGKSPEGPHLYKINDYYYLLVAEGGTEYGHMVTLARSETPYGPFESCPRNPILSHRSTWSPIQATGHADLVQAADGRWWLVFLAVRPNGYPPCYHLGRETFLAPVTWDDEGWPIIGDNGLVRLHMDTPHTTQEPWDMETVRDDFVTDQLGLQWNFLRNPRPASWSLTERAGWLRLTGTAETLESGGAPAFVGRRQQHFRCRAIVELDFMPQRDREEAGLTVFMNERHHYEIAITRVAGSRCVIVRRRIGTLSAVVAQDWIDEGHVILTIDAEHDWYTFSYAVDGGVPHTLGRGETRYLATEVAGGFTGVYFAMYATGNGEAAQTPAYFDYFEYLPLEDEA